MTTITTKQIVDRLSGSFNAIQPLVKIDANNIFNAAHVHTATVINMLSIELVIGVYSLTDDIENGDYQRYLYIPQTKDAFTF